MARQHMNSVFYATTYHPIQAGSIDGTDTASHDNGVYRALLASSTGLYDPTGDPKAEGDPYCTLFVGRLAHHTTEKTLHEAMSKFGKVKHLRLARHIVTGASRGYAFVEFETENDMHNAYEVAQNVIIDGSSILVDYNRQHLMAGWIPRRLGGGLGGRKESGQLRFGGRDRPFRAPLRTIPSEQLLKLGIPLPPVGRYMPRFQLPPLPKRPGGSKEGAHRKQKSSSSSRRSPFRETFPSKSLGEDDRAETERRAEQSSREGRRSGGAERGSSPKEERRSAHRAEGDAEGSDKGDRGHDDAKQHKKRRRHSDHDDHRVDREKASRSSHEDRESSRHRDRGHEYVSEQKRSRSDEEGNEQFDHENSTRSGLEDRESSRHLERSSSRSRRRHGDSGHRETSTSRSGYKDREHGHHHARDRDSPSKESATEYERPPKHGNEHSSRSQSKHRRKDD